MKSGTTRQDYSVLFVKMHQMQDQSPELSVETLRELEEFRQIAHDASSVEQFYCLTTTST